MTEERKKTPLMECEDVDIARAIIEETRKKGGDEAVFNLVNAKDEEGRTALMYCQNPEVVQLLIDNKADVNAKDDWENSVLVYGQNKERTDILLNNGADPFFLTSTGNNTIDIAQNTQCVEAIMDHVYEKYGQEKIDEMVTHSDEAGNPAYASCYHDIEQLRTFFKYDTKIKPINDTGFNALAFMDDVEEIKLLIKQGADINAIGKDGTPLMNCKDLEMAKFYVENGADVNIMVNGETAKDRICMDIAVQEDIDPEYSEKLKGVAEYLIGHGARSGEDLKKEQKSIDTKSISNQAKIAHSTMMQNDSISVSSGNSKMDERIDGRKTATKKEKTNTRTDQKSR